MQAEVDLTMRKLSLIFETKDFFEFSHGDRSFYSELDQPVLVVPPPLKLSQTFRQ